MAAVAHGWTPPASSGIDIPMGVAKEFNAADAKIPTNRMGAVAAALRKNHA